LAFYGAKKTTQRGWLKGKSGSLTSQETSWSADVGIIRKRNRAVKSTLTMLLIVKARIAMKRGTGQRAFCAPGRCAQNLQVI
jgi:hypothetical protein